MRLFGEVEMSTTFLRREKAKQNIKIAIQTQNKKANKYPSAETDHRKETSTAEQLLNLS